MQRDAHTCSFDPMSDENVTFKGPSTNQYIGNRKDGKMKNRHQYEINDVVLITWQ